MRNLNCSLLLIALLACWPAAASAESGNGEALARRLFNAQGCRACHRLEGEGGTLGPDLKGVGQRLDRNALLQQLSNPEHRHGNGRLPDFHHLNASELNALVEFLAGQR